MSKKCKETWLNDQCAERQQYSQVQNTHMLFKKANEICEKPVTKLPPVKSRDGKTLENTEEDMVAGKSILKNFITYKIQSTKTY